MTTKGYKSVRYGIYWFLFMKTYDVTDYRFTLTDTIGSSIESGMAK